MANEVTVKTPLANVSAVPPAKGTRITDFWS
jgi:hypothetical protein